MKNFEEILKAVIIVLIFIWGINAGYNHALSEIQEPKTKEGTMHGLPTQELPKRDSVTYNQHDCDYKARNTWQNR